MKNYSLFPLLSIVSISTPVMAQDQGPSSPFSFSLSYTLDSFHTNNDAIANKSANIDNLSAAVHYEGSKSNIPNLRGLISVFYTNGKTISGDNIGDLQGISNIETGYKGAFLNELWLELGFGAKYDDEYSIAVRFGQIDLNGVFDAPGASAIFINPSHGIVPIFSQTGENGPSIYPVLGLGLVSSFRLSDKARFRAGFFDGHPGNSERPNKIDWSLNADDGNLFVAETEYKSETLRLLGGGFAYSKATAPLIGTKDQKNSGLYGQIELYPGNDLTLFSRFGSAKPKLNYLDKYVSFGFTKNNMFGASDHQFGIAMAKAQLSNDAKSVLSSNIDSETNYEVTYLVPIADKFSIQGDYQLIRNAGGLPQQKDISLFGVRFKYSLGN